LLKKEGLISEWEKMMFLSKVIKTQSRAISEVKDFSLTGLGSNKDDAKKISHNNKLFKSALKKSDFCNLLEKYSEEHKAELDSARNKAENILREARKRAEMIEKEAYEKAH